MSIRSQVQYIGEFIRSELGHGCFLPSDVTANSNPTTIRVLKPEIFDPGGGTVYWINGSTDDFFTYTAISGDTLTGVPANGTGSIDANMYDYADANNTPTFIYIMGVDDEELERNIDRQRSWTVSEMRPDAEKKRWKAKVGWWDSDVEIRDDDDSSYNSISLGGSDSISYERGEVIFDTARTESVLYLAGWVYNPFYTMASIYLIHGADDKNFTYLQAGQIAGVKPTADKLVEKWRSLGFAQSFNVD